VIVVERLTLEFTQELKSALSVVGMYVDYYRKARGGKPEGRLNQAWFGSGANIKERTWKYLLNNI